MTDVLRNCNKGRVATVKQLNSDCDCPPGISSITQSADKTKMYINLTDGATVTIDLLQGATGATGSTGATEAAGAEGAILLFNSIDPSATAGTGGEALKTFTMAAGQMANDGDMLHIHSRFSTGTPNGGQSCSLLFNAVNLFGIASLFNATGIDAIFIDSWITRYSSTIMKYETKVSIQSNAFIGTVQSDLYTSNILVTGGIDWAATNNIITYGNSVVSGDVVNGLLQVTYSKFKT